VNATGAGGSGWIDIRIVCIERAQVTYACPPKVRLQYHKLRLGCTTNFTINLHRLA
jgi:hypothetical protein